MVDAPNPQTYNARPILGPIVGLEGAGWSSLVARRAHNPKVVGSNPAPATIEKEIFDGHMPIFCIKRYE